MNQLKEIGGLSKMLSSSLEASKNAQEQYQNDVLSMLDNIFQDLHSIHDYLIYGVKPCPDNFDESDPRCSSCKWFENCKHDSE